VKLQQDFGQSIASATFPGNAQPIFMPQATDIFPASRRRNHGTPQ
jgi:hypothetical protein